MLIFDKRCYILEASLWREVAFRNHLEPNNSVAHTHPFTYQRKGTGVDKKPMTKTETIAALCEATELSKDQVTRLLDELGKLIGKNLSEDGPGVFSVPGLMKIKVVRKPPTPEREGINPFTKEKTIFKAKPARNVVKISALKGLKDMV